MLPLDKEAEPYDHANVYYLFLKRFTKENYKVKDHCHITGAFRGPTCNTCNLKFKTLHFLLVLFHNLRNNDLHFYISSIILT